MEKRSYVTFLNGWKKTMVYKKSLRSWYLRSFDGKGLMKCALQIGFSP